MKKLIPFPVTVVQEIENYVTTNYPTIKESGRVKLFSVLLELWFFIKSKHVGSIAHLEDTNKQIKDSGKSHLNWVNISQSELIHFNVSIDKSRVIYSRLLDILIDLNLIERNDTYEVGNFSKSYRPHVNLKYESTKSININTKKIFKKIQTKSDLYKNTPFRYRKMIDDLYLTKIDLEQFFYDIDQMLGMRYSSNTKAVLTYNKIYALKIRALKINLGIHWISISETGRVYSSITNLPQIMIKYIRLNNEKVVEIDAANSQPLLLSSLVNHSKFTRDVESGVFYEAMAESMGITRSEFKGQSYKYIFFNENEIGSTWRKRLDAVYPGLANQINEIKKTDKLWFLLQKAEADIWIKIAQKQPDPVLTRHDSILITDNEIESIKKQLKTEYKKRGMKVTLK